jgi:enhancer of polycomb-like protein
MASQRAAGQRFRQRKLSTKQNLAILRENEVEAIFDDEAQRNIPRVETGVEKAEEVVSIYPDISLH